MTSAYSTSFLFCFFFFRVLARLVPVAKGELVSVGYRNFAALRGRPGLAPSTPCEIRGGLILVQTVAILRVSDVLTET